MARRCDARSEMDVGTDPAFLGARRLAGVHAHPHAHGAGGERRLGGERGRDRLARLGEREEKGVALRVDLGASVRSERLA